MSSPVLRLTKDIRTLPGPKRPMQVAVLEEVSSDRQYQPGVRHFWYERREPTILAALFGGDWEPVLQLRRGDFEVTVRGEDRLPMKGVLNPEGTAVEAWDHVDLPAGFMTRRDGYETALHFRHTLMSGPCLLRERRSRGGEIVGWRLLARETRDLVAAKLLSEAD